MPQNRTIMRIGYAFDSFRVEVLALESLQKELPSGQTQGCTVTMRAAIMDWGVGFRVQDLGFRI